MQLRTHALFAVSLASIAFVFTTSGSAAPPAGGAAPAPGGQAKVDLPARVISVKRTATRAKYASGPLSYEIEVAAPTLTPLATNVVFDGLFAGKVTAPVSAPAGGRTTVTLVDPKGLQSTCSSYNYKVYLETGGPGNARSWKVTPNCTFGVDVVNPSAALSVQQQLQQADGKVTYVSPSLTPSTIACGTPGQVKAMVANRNTQTVAKGVHLRLVGPGGSTTNASGTGPGLLGKGESKEAFVTFPGDLVSGKYALTVEATDVPEHAPGWNVQLKPSCDVDVSVVP